MMYDTLMLYKEKNERTSTTNDVVRGSFVIICSKVWMKQQSLYVFRLSATSQTLFALLIALVETVDDIVGDVNRRVRVEDVVTALADNHLKTSVTIVVL